MSSSSSSSTSSKSSSSSSSWEDHSSFRIVTTGADQIGITTDAASNFIIRWGDGDETIVTNVGTVETLHTYAGAGTYILTLKGTATRFQFSTNPSKLAEILSPIQGITGLTSFESTFRACSGLTSIPSGLFDNNTLVTSFATCFRDCTALTAIPSGLFDNNTLVTAFGGCFRNCDNITSIPSGLFDNNTLVTFFSETFYDCIGLTSIPSGLFDNNTKVTTFASCFRSCNNVAFTSIPSGLFDNNTKVTTFAFCFRSCTRITAIPSGLFDNNTLVTTFGSCFSGDTAIANDVPTLWTRVSAPTGTDCYLNCTSATNYDSIPETWGGPAVSSSSSTSSSTSSSSSLYSKSSSSSSTSSSTSSSSSLSLEQGSSSSSTSSSTSSSSSEQYSLSSSSSSGIGTGWTWGEEFPSPETSDIWTNWKFKESAVEAPNTGAYGLLQVYNTDQLVSNVKDSGEARVKYLRISYDDYNTGSGSGRIYWRGSNTSFAQNSDEITGPVWELYVAGTYKDWRYIQVRVEE